MIIPVLSKQISSSYIDFLNKELKEAWDQWDDEWKEFEQQELINITNSILADYMGSNNLLFNNLKKEIASKILDAIFYFEKDTTIDFKWASLSKEIQDKYRDSLISSFSAIIDGNLNMRKNIIFLK